MILTRNFFEAGNKAGTIKTGEVKEIWGEHLITSS